MSKKEKGKQPKIEKEHEYEENNPNSSISYTTHNTRVINSVEWNEIYVGFGKRWFCE